MTVKNLKGVTAASDQLMKAFKDGNEESFSAAIISKILLNKFHLLSLLFISMLLL